MTITAWPKAHLGTALTATPPPSPPADRRIDRLRQAWFTFRHGSWRLHILAAIEVMLPCGDRREAVDELLAAGFAVQLFHRGQPVASVPFDKARLMRPRPIADHGWLWTVAFDTEITVASRHIATCGLTAVVNYDSATVHVAAITVEVIARLAVLPHTFGAAVTRAPSPTRRDATTLAAMSGRV
jgi:hypothetical protein